MMARKSTTVKEKEHMNRVASLGCICCLNMGLGETPAEIHHIGNGTMGKRASNYEVIPLCETHHRTGNIGTAVHAGRKSFEANFGSEQTLLKQVSGWLSLCE